VGLAGKGGRDKRCAERWSRDEPFEEATDGRATESKTRMEREEMGRKEGK
jgi:hypothetical protein